MPGGKEPRERSVSGEFDDSDFESHTGDGPHPPGKPGRKKNPNSQAARRDQNRIAQREFRLRKQQRIRDLEARVELLSGGKDEALGEMRNILKDLMQENQTLRNLLRNLGQFIGDGAGGLLPKLGWDMADFNNFVNRSETDTAWESFQRRKKPQSAQSIVSSSQAAQGQKRPADGESNTSRSKKARSPNDDTESDRGQNGYSLLVPMPPPGANNIYPSASRPPPEGNSLFSNGSPMFMQPSPTTNTTPQYSGSSSNVNNYQSSYIPSINMNLEPTLPFSSAGSNTTSIQRRIPQTNRLSPEQVEDDEDPNKNEAYKLIHYHLDNYKRNNAYCLPSSLRPTTVQRSVPHESLIDGILHPDIRDRMILQRAHFNLVDCLHDYRNAVTIHGDDVLAHSNWEIGEHWLRRYGFLVEQPTLNIINRWRRERAEPELRLSDLVPADNTPGSA